MEARSLGSWSNWDINFAPFMETFLDVAAVENISEERNCLDGWFLAAEVALGGGVVCTCVVAPWPCNLLITCVANPHCTPHCTME